jgi:hypothetical protein
VRSELLYIKTIPSKFVCSEYFQKFVVYFLRIQVSLCEVQCLNTVVLAVRRAG